MTKQELLDFLDAYIVGKDNNVTPQTMHSAFERGILKTILTGIVELSGDSPTPPVPPTAGPLKLTLREDGVIGMVIPAEIPTVEYIEYSADGADWTKVDRTPGEKQVITLLEGSTGDSVYVRGQATAYAYIDGEDYFYSCNISAFVTLGGDLVDFDIEGNILSLLGDTDFATTTKTFEGLFMDTFVVDASKLVLPDIVTEGCYTGMFSGCSELTAAPELPATVLAEGCYSEMFSGCMSLITTPELIATTLAEECYAGMFNGCTSLTTAPALPATTLAAGCYNTMFTGCSSLQEVTMFATDISAENCLNEWLASAGIDHQSKIIINDEASFSQQDLNYDNTYFAVYNQSGDLIWDYQEII